MIGACAIAAEKEGGEAPPLPTQSQKEGGEAPPLPTRSQVDGDWPWNEGFFPK
jgi:hypothetical protein